MLALVAPESWKSPLGKSLGYNGRSGLGGKPGGAYNGGDVMQVTAESPPLRGTMVMSKGDRTLRAMRVLTTLDPSISFQMMMMFLLIADHHPQGIAQAELLGTINPDRQNISRWVKRFGEHPFYRVGFRGQPKSMNLGLVRKQTSAYDQRVNVLILTPKGVKVKEQIDGVE